MTNWAVGIATALTDNIANNLPVGLIAGSVAAGDHLPSSVVAAMLIGVDLGPNLSITGSLATILWLVTLRREGIDVTAWRFLRIGLLVMPPALVSSLSNAEHAIGGSMAIDVNRRGVPTPIGTLGH